MITFTKRSVNSSRQSCHLLIPIFLASFCLSAFGERPVEPVTGTYKDALRKAGEEGKPLLIEFWSDHYVDCKRQKQQMEQMPEMMRKFVYYRIKGDQNPTLVKQFNVVIFPTLIFLKPNGTECHRQTSIYAEIEQFKNALDRALDKAGPIAKSEKRREAPSDQTPAGAAKKTAYENAASNELKAAMNQLTVGRKADAIKKLKQVTTHYPGSEAATLAQEKLEELEPDNKDK